MTVIGLAGYARVGKDTAAAHLVDAHGFVRVGFADPLKDLAYELNPTVEGTMEGVVVELRSIVQHFGWDRGKTLFPEVRDYLVTLGAGARKIIGPEVWTTALRHRVEALGDVDVVVSDVRYPNEAQLVRDLGGIVWGITRPNVGPANEEEERSMADVFPHRWISNGGTEADLRTVVDASLRVVRALEC